ncbi:MAG: YqeG family HAD IIIA-type phosphatase [Lachnospiraceae bacterium]|nr:YqeG family HAD IIIA-type phosphatase [Lachnospiraceae bacterium]
MFKKFKPDMDVKSVYDIDFDDLYNEGIKGIIFDIDNTLVAHDAPYNDQSDELVQSLIDKGFKLFILSNNDEDRVKLFIQNVYIDYIYKSGKPSSKNYYAAFEKMGLKKEEVIAIGDQLFTDCLGAKNAGIKFIRVGIVSKKEPPHIKLKRILEKPVELLSKI